MNALCVPGGEGECGREGSSAEEGSVIDLAGRIEPLGWVALDAMSSGVALLDADGIILATNLAWRRCCSTMADPDSCGVGASFLTVCEAAIGPGTEQAAAVSRDIRAVLARESTTFELEYTGTYGEPQSRSLMTVSSTGAGLAAAVVMHTDISDRYRAQLAVAESEERFRSVFLDAPLGILRFDAYGRVMEVNPAFARMVDRREEDIVGRHRSELFRGEVPAQTDPGAHPSGGPGAALTIICHFERANGDLGTCRIYEVVFLDGDGAPRGMLATVEDITDRLELQRGRRNTEQLAALGRLAAGIAHEINTPTQFIADNITFLSDIWGNVSSVLRAAEEVVAAIEPQDPAAAGVAGLRAAIQRADLDFVMAEVPDALEQTEDGLRRVARIVRAMRSFGHPDREAPELTDLNHLVRNTVTVARNELKYVADVVTNLGDLPLLLCHPGEISQVILNLLLNAADAITDAERRGADRGLVKIRTWVEGDYHCLSVADTGSGIAPDVLPHVFEPFFTTKPIGKGTGQGLALAWATIVDRHHGQLEVGSSDTGTTFTIRIPGGGGAADRAGAATTVPAAAAGSK